MVEHELLWAGVDGQAAAVRRRDVSARELAAAVLDRIHKYDRHLNAFSVVMADEALAEAAARDSETGERGPLHGVPVAVKEAFDVRGHVTTHGGRGNSTPAAADAAAVARLRAAGAVVVGKTAMSEFGQWPFTESVAHGITRNPWDVGRSPGGSSGGSAAAVAAGLVATGLGDDGGGSIRIPAACCGLFGLKPQRGRVSTAPYEHGWWSLSTIGALTRGVRDAALVYDAIRGSLPTDRFRAEEPPTSFTEAVDGAERLAPLRIGVLARPTMTGARAEPEGLEAMHATADLLVGLGHHVEEVSVRLPDATAALVPQFLAGVRAQRALVEHPDLLERRTRETVRLGAWVTPGIREWAIDRDRTVAARAERAFAGHDLLLTPTMAVRPPRVGVLDGIGAVRAVLASLPMIAHVAFWNVTGNPAASVPAGFGRDGLPLGVQLVGRPHDEPTVLALAAQLERVRPWAVARPQL